MHKYTYWKEIISFLTGISECLDRFQHHQCTIKKFSVYVYVCVYRSAKYVCFSTFTLLFLLFFFDIFFHFLVYHHQRCYIIRVVFRQLCGAYFFQTICVVCVLYSSFYSMFIRFATDVYKHTLTLCLHSFVLWFSHFIFSWACNVLCRMRDNLNTHSVILFSSSYICVDILSALSMFSLRSHTHTHSNHFPFSLSFIVAGRIFFPITFFCKTIIYSFLLIIYPHITPAPHDFHLLKLIRANSKKNLLAFKMKMAEAKLICEHTYRKSHSPVHSQSV